MYANLEFMGFKTCSCFYSNGMSLVQNVCERPPTALHWETWKDLLKHLSIHRNY